MIRVPLTEDSLRVAFSRIRDFQTVHAGKEDYEEAFVILSESLGVGTDSVAIILTLMEDFLGEEASEDPQFMSGTLFGLMVGLIAADYASET